MFEHSSGPCMMFSDSSRPQNCSKIFNSNNDFQIEVLALLKLYGFCNKSFRKDEPLTLFQYICHHLWVGLLLHPANPPKNDVKYVEKVFNWSEVHLSEMTYKIHTLRAQH